MLVCVRNPQLPKACEIVLQHRQPLPVARCKALAKTVNRF